jgi:PIN domain nuclease of toxin-antitoxin system
MAPTAHLDTHVALWLHDSVVEKLSSRQRELIETCNLSISEFVRLEMQFLYEIGRIKTTPDHIVAHLAAHADVTLSTCSLHALMNEAIKVHWTRDPFDRLIVANALAEKVTLITLDRVILKNCHCAVG